MANEQGPRSYQVRTSTVVRRNQRDLDKRDLDEHLSGDNTPPITQFSISSDTSQLSRSSKQSKPPNRYGVWLNSVHQNWGEM